MSLAWEKPWFFGSAPSLLPTDLLLQVILTPGRHHSSSSAAAPPKVVNVLKWIPSSTAPVCLPQFEPQSHESMLLSSEQPVE